MHLEAVGWRRERRLLKRASSGANAEVGNFFPESSGQIDLMVLLLDEDLTNLFRHGVFT